MNWAPKSAINQLIKWSRWAIRPSKRGSVNNFYSLEPPNQCQWQAINGCSSNYSDFRCRRPRRRPPGNDVCAVWTRIRTPNINNRNNLRFARPATLQQSAINLLSWFIASNKVLSGRFGCSRPFFRLSFQERASGGRSWHRSMGAHNRKWSSNNTICPQNRNVLLPLTLIEVDLRICPAQIAWFRLWLNCTEHSWLTH